MMILIVNSDIHEHVCIYTCAYIVFINVHYLFACMYPLFYIIAAVFNLYLRKPQSVYRKRKHAQKENAPL